VPFAWFVAFRYMRAAKAQTALILAAVSVGVGVVVFLSALINGLADSLVEKTLGSQAHVTLQVPREAPRALVEPIPGLAIARVRLPATQRLRSIDRWPAVLADAERSPSVTAAAPVILGAGFAVRFEQKQAIVLEGLDPDRALAIIDLRKRMVAGRFDISGAEVVVGSKLASDLDLHVRDTLRLTTSEGRTDLVTVAGIFTLGNEAVDKSLVVLSLRHAQSLFALPGGATTIQLKLTDVFEAERVAELLADRTGLEADSWMKLNVQLLEGLSAQNSSKLLIQFLVVVAVALGIASVLAVSVVQKEREIGILRAVGTDSRRVLRIFLIQGGVLGFVGSIAGCALGALLASAFQALSLDAQGAPKFPITLNLSIFAGASLLATAVGLLAAVAPARRAARIDPALAIRNG